MAIRITVIECDGCGKCAGLKTDEDWHQFGLNWEDSLYHQFCEDCKRKVENRAQIQLDLETMQRIAANFEPEWAEIID